MNTMPVSEAFHALVKICPCREMKMMLPEARTDWVGIKRPVSFSQAGFLCYIRQDRVLRETLLVCTEDLRHAERSRNWCLMLLDHVEVFCRSRKADQGEET